MRVQRLALLLAAGVAVVSFDLSAGAFAQTGFFGRGGGGFHAGAFGGGNRDRGGYGNGGRKWDGPRRHRGGLRGPGIVVAIPPTGGGRFIDDDTADEPADHRHRARHHKRHTPRRAVTQRRRGPSGAPPAGEQRLVPDEVLIEVSNSVSQRQINTLRRRFRLEQLESQHFQLSRSHMFLWHIPDRRSVSSVVRALESDRLVTNAQPNYVYTLQQGEPKPASEGSAAQYELAKLHLPQAHTLAKGDNVRVAVIDSAIDLKNSELSGSILDSFDAVKTPRKPHAHGTAIAGLIVAHGKLMGAAPNAKILAVRAFDPDSNGAKGTTFNILKGVDWAAEKNARVINMSFAGPADPALHRALEAAHKKNIVLIAAAGNAGAKSPPLYPAAEPEVIAVTATDVDNHLFAQSNRGRQIAVAAPGADILVALPDGRYEMSSGTSYSAAEVSGVAALLLQRVHKLRPDRVRSLLEKTAQDLGAKGRDRLFGAGLVNAFDALVAARAPVTASVPLPVRRVTNGTQ